MMTEKMFERCLNKNKNYFEDCPTDVQETCRAHEKYIQYYAVFPGEWVDTNPPRFYPRGIYRINPLARAYLVTNNETVFKLNIFEKCKNKELKIFANMEKEVQDMINKCEEKYGSKSLEALGQMDAKWHNISCLKFDVMPAQRYTGRIFRISDEYIKRLEEDYDIKTYIQDIVIMGSCEGMMCTSSGHYLSKIAVDNDGIHKVAVPRFNQNNEKYPYDKIMCLEDVMELVYFEEIIFDKVTRRPAYVVFNNNYLQI